jgi:hypothetical protein
LLNYSNSNLIIQIEEINNQIFTKNPSPLNPNTLDWRKLDANHKRVGNCQDHPPGSLLKCAAFFHDIGSSRVTKNKLTTLFSLPWVLPIETHLTSDGWWW